jgi:hypothetical protein
MKRFLAIFAVLALGLTATPMNAWATTTPVVPPVVVGNWSSDYSWVLPYNLTLNQEDTPGARNSFGGTAIVGLLNNTKATVSYTPLNDLISAFRLNTGYSLQAVFPTGSNNLSSNIKIDCMPESASLCFNQANQISASLPYGLPANFKLTVIDPTKAGKMTFRVNMPLTEMMKKADEWLALYAIMDLIDGFVWKPAFTTHLAENVSQFTEEHRTDLNGYLKDWQAGDKVSLSQDSKTLASDVLELLKQAVVENSVTILSNALLSVLAAPVLIPVKVMKTTADLAAATKSVFDWALNNQTVLGALVTVQYKPLGTTGVVSCPAVTNQLCYTTDFNDTYGYSINNSDKAIYPFNSEYLSGGLALSAGFGYQGLASPHAGWPNVPGSPCSSFYCDNRGGLSSDQFSIPSSFNGARYVGITLSGKYTFGDAGINWMTSRTVQAKVTPYLCDTTHCAITTTKTQTFQLGKNYAARTSGTTVAFRADSSGAFNLTNTWFMGGAYGLQSAHPLTFGLNADLEIVGLDFTYARLALSDLKVTIIVYR